MRHKCHSQTSLLGWDDSKPNSIGLQTRLARFIPVMIILGMTAWSYYAYVYYLCFERIECEKVRAWYLSVYHVLLVMFLWSYLRTVFTGPKSPPPEYQLPGRSYEMYSRNPTDCCIRNAILRAFINSADFTLVTMLNEYDQVRFCEECRSVRPDRSRHCAKCDRCVLKMHNHCPMINNCVSFTNYKYYLLQLAYGLAMCVAVVVTTAAYNLWFWNDSLEPYTRHGPYVTHIHFLLSIGTAFSLFLATLVWWNVKLISRNNTPKEYDYPPIFSDEVDPRASFDLGVRENLRQVFGDHVLLWFFPVFTTLGDGIVFPLSAANRKSGYADSV